ncbi:DUF6054 family protein [Actinotalea sp. M2MS4P-6]|uniref:DUF6054 family protein n=1 Tax=Actinotalea sp. M2MS4P-6 TaxID=2983762 RepID=UPI0021E35E6B|nr:DUF6054 family protein [Actinotalea sp. M2MS4P-6]MCV2396253.1 DUF6054 family protein [Actinotalea sp. M2MS4P-6]
MAQADYTITGDLDRFVAHLDHAIEQGSATAMVEAKAERRLGDARMAVRVYERFSMVGGNRLSLSVSALAVGDRIEVVVVTSGGSEGVVMKLNTFGEKAFLAKADEAVRAFRG